MATTLTINGQERSFDAPPEMPLLWVLRDILGLTGTKFGCGIAQCGACTVHVDGKPVRSCVLPVGNLQSRAITCPSRKLHPHVAMMQSAQHWCRDDGSASLDGASQRRVLAQPQVRARLIVVERIRGQDPSQMPLAEDQDVIQALAAECSDQALNIGILPG